MKEIKEDKIEIGIIIGSFFIPIIGIVIGIKNLCKHMPKSGIVYLISSIIAMIIYANILPF